MSGSSSSLNVWNAFRMAASRDSQMTLDEILRTRPMIADRHGLTTPELGTATLTQPAGDRDRRVGEEGKYRAQRALELGGMIGGCHRRIAHGVGYGLHLMVCETLGSGSHVSSSSSLKDWRNLE
jgi:hypothetical protein